MERGRWDEHYTVRLFTLAELREQEQERTMSSSSDDSNEFQSAEEQQEPERQHQDKQQGKSGKSSESIQTASLYYRLGALLARCARSPGGWSWENFARLVWASLGARRELEKMPEWGDQHLSKMCPKWFPGSLLELTSQPILEMAQNASLEPSCDQFLDQP